jgi:hypothetical protein
VSGLYWVSRAGFIKPALRKSELATPTPPMDEFLEPTNWAKAGETNRSDKAVRMIIFNIPIRLTSH